MGASELKILYYGESPLNPTGFGQVNKHILAALARTGQEVTCVASTHYYAPEASASLPYNIIGCTGEDPRNLQAIEAAVKAGEWDLYWYQGDIGANNDVLAWVKNELDRDPAKQSVFYVPLDCDVAIAEAFEFLRWPTVAAVYTHHAKSVIARYCPDLGEKVSVIQLGCETDTFYPLSPEEKRAARLEIFGEWAMDRFLVLNVNRNQVRKDLARCMGLFHKFHARHPDATLYMHSVQNDSGGSLPVQAHLVGCNIYAQPPEIAFSGLDLAAPWERETLNKLYNAADLLVSTSYGEGWGLTTTEAMCAGTPVLVPANTANLDILGNSRMQARSFDYERAWGMRTGGDLDHTVFIYGKNLGSPHGFVHEGSFLASMEYIYSHRKEVAAKADIARQWCLENSWRNREAEWEALIHTLTNQVEVAV